MRPALLALALALALALSSLARAQAPRVFVTAVPTRPGDAQAARELAALARAALLEAEGFSVRESLGVLHGDLAASLTAYGQAREALQRGRQAYLALELPAARSELERAMALWPAALAVLDSPEPVSETLLYLGASCLLAGDASCARRAFARHQAAFAELEPDARVFNPAIIAAWRREARAPSGDDSAGLWVQCSESAAEITLDGRPVGVGSYRSEQLAPGPHWLRVAVLGSRPWVKLLELPAHATERVQVPELGGDASLASALDGARDGPAREALRKLLGAQALMVIAVSSGPDGVELGPHYVGSVSSAARPPLRAGASFHEGAAMVRVAVADFLEQVARVANEREPLTTSAAQASSQPVDQPSRKPWYRRPWLWTVVGVALAAGVTGGVLIARSQHDAQPSGDRDASLTLEF